MKKSAQNKNVKIKDGQLIPIVGIGASAGGLAALKTFFSYVPKDSGIAYVVVVHLSPEHKSVLAELLQPYINIPVEQVSDTVELRPNQVYVIPPNANLNTIDTHLRLSELEKRRSERAPIDHFFRTLSKTHEGEAIGIVLTGTGSDGTLGLKEIKEKGGLTIVQDPEEAEYNGMPQSAIAAGLVDMVLPIKEMSSYFINYLKTKPELKSLDPDQKPDSIEQQIIHKIFAQVKAITRRDFGHYKLSTILRRLQRRMQIYQIEHLNDYLDLLRNNPQEIRALSDDFLITVTSFFRDPKAFKYLKEKIIPIIIKNKKPDDQIRIWSVGCATGEEAYSLAILMAEITSKLHIAPSVQIFASDLHDASLKMAREGFFPGDIKADVNADRLKRFFIKENNGYRIRKEIREHVIFTPHNLLGDPPFSRLDLVVCRNLLIYLKRNIQQDVFELFHYALLPKGYMVLGTSEHLDNGELFSLESKEYSVYEKTNFMRPEPRLPVFPRMQSHTVESPVSDRENYAFPPGILHQKMIEQYGPPSLMLGFDYQLLHVSETAGRYLNIPGGEFSRDIFKLIHPQLQVALRAIINEAIEKRVAVRSRAQYIRINGVDRQMFISARTVGNAEKKHVILVMFEEYEIPEGTGKAEKKSDEEEIYDARTNQLEEEIKELRQHLQAVIEEYETSREEMKASNEELQSANEELRSTMEELETSKEELQSVNEELSTLNQENRHKVEELSQLTSDLQNLLTATDIATLFLDREYRILRFTPRLGELFNIRPADRGRLISDLTNKLGYDDLITDARKVIKNLQPVEKEVKEQNGNSYLTRLLPYRSEEDRIEGVVITFVDITEQKKTEEELRRSDERFNALIDAASSAMFRMNADWTEMIELRGRNFLSDTLKPDKKWIEKYFYHDDEEQLKKTISHALRSASMFSMEHRIRLTDGNMGWALTRAVPLMDKNGKMVEWFGESNDITERKKAEDDLKILKEYNESIIQTLHEPLLVLYPDLKVKFANPAFYNFFDVNKKETENHPIYKVGNGLMDNPDLRKLLEELLPMNNVFNNFEIVHEFAKTGKRSLLLNARKLQHEQLILLGIRDNTESKEAEYTLQNAKDIAEKAGQAKEEFLTRMSHEIRTPLNVVVGLSHLLLNQEPKKEQLENLNILKIAAENLSNLINNVLDYSKIQAGKMSVDLKAFNLQDFIGDIVKIYRNIAQEKKINFMVNLDEQLPEAIISDRLKLSQVLFNLLGNAMKYTRKGEVTLDINLNRRNRQSMWIDFIVSDTGIGISEEKQEIIFNAFTRLDNPDELNYNGTGLGLSITSLYLKMLGSRINVESKPGKGSRFSFRLHVQSDNFDETEKKESIIQGQAENLLKNITILLAEDDEFNLMMIKQMLDLWQVKYDEAMNGQQAYDLAKNKNYDLILMDVRMPILDGCESSDKIRSLPGYKGKPIIALTADVSERVKNEIKSGLFTEVAVKPVNPETLKRKIIELVSKNRK